MPALLEKNDFVYVTCDDDCYYPPYWVRDLIRTWSGSTNEIVAHRVHTVKFNTDMSLANYEDWDFDVREQNKFLFFTGCGGVLYPSGCFHSDVLDIDKYKDICFRQDDIWFNWMARLAGTKVVKSISQLEVISWNGTDATGLFKDNSNFNGNNLALKRMCEIFGNVFCK